MISLAAFAAPATTALDNAITQVNSNQPAQRIEAAQILKENRTPLSAQALNQSLSREENPQVILALLDAMGSMPELISVASVASKLSREEAPLRKRAAYVLGLAGGPKAEQALSQALLRESNPGVKAMLLQSLSVCGSENSLTVIENALKDGRPEVKAKAAETLRFIPGEKAKQARERNRIKKSK